MDTAPASGRSTPPIYIRFILGRNPSMTVLRILVVVLLVFIVFKFILLPIRVTGHSMWPTFHNGEIKFVNRLAYRGDKPARGDVVAAEFDRGAVLLKRVIALPGETFQVIEGFIYINGERLEEPYTFGKIRHPPNNPASKVITLESDQYGLFGDNRPDSDIFLKYEHQILGKVF